MGAGVESMMALLSAGFFSRLVFFSVSHACQAQLQSCITVSWPFLSSSVSSDDAGFLELGRQRFTTITSILQGWIHCPEDFSCELVFQDFANQGKVRCSYRWDIEGHMLLLHLWQTSLINHSRSLTEQEHG